MIKSKKLVAFFVYIIVFWVLISIFSSRLAHADTEDIPATITYELNDETRQVSLEEIQQVGISQYNPDGIIDGPVYLVVLPQGSAVKSIQFNGNDTSYDWYDQMTQIALLRDDRTRTVLQEYDASLLSKETNFLINGEFLNDPNQNRILRNIKEWTNKDAVLTDKVKGFIAVHKYMKDEDQTDGKVTYIFIQIVTDSSASEVDKTALEELIDSIPTTGYYTEGDTWNGKDESENGFWADMQAIKTQIEDSIADTGITQQGVDSKVEQYTESLNQAKAKLISINNVNASSLYETKKIIDATAGLNDETRYSSASWSAFMSAKDSVDALFAELYDDETHKPTEANTADRAEDVANLKVMLESARDNLLYKEKEDLLPRWMNVANWILSQDREAAKYTETSWTTWMVAKEALDEIVKQEAETLLQSKTKYNEFIKAVCDAVEAWFGLEETSERITVHVRVVDNYGMRHPEYAIKDERTATFNGDITLTDNKTLQGLFGDDGGLDTRSLTVTNYEQSLIDDNYVINDTGNRFRVPTQRLHSHTYAYVNGKLVVARSQDERGDEVESASLTHFDIYGGTFNTNDLPLEDYFPVLKTKLSDGDDVVIIRTEAPLWRSVTASAGHLCTYADYRYLYHNFTELIVGGDQMIEAKPDEKITLTINEEEKTVDVSDTNQKAAEGVNLFLSDPQISEDAAKGEPTLNIITEPDEDDVKPVETDDEGKVEFSVDKEGWYKLQPVKGGETLEVYGDLDGMKDGIFPNLAAGNCIFLHITLDDDFDELTEPKQEAEDAFDALETAEDAYEASRSAAAEAVETPGDEAVEAASQAVTDAEAVVKAAEDTKAAAEAYLDKVTALAEKKDQMTDAHKAEIEEALEKAVADVQKAEDAIASGKEELADAKEVLDKAETKAALKKCLEEIEQLKGDDPLAAEKKAAIDKVNKYLEDNAKNILESDADSVELAALKAFVTIKDAASTEEITKAVNTAIAKIDKKIAAKKAADDKAAKIKAAKAQKVKGLKVKVKKNKATVSWKKNTEATGYEVYSSMKKKGKFKKVATIKKNTKIKFVNKKLKKGKKYFYKVRTFTTIDGKNYYGKYTKVKATKRIK